MGLSKAFDNINHELLIAKLYAYSLRSKINKSFNSWSALLQGVPQGSVPGQILFSIYLNNLF